MKILFLLFLSFSATGETIPDYERNTWRHWIDSDGDCLNTRHELLARESLIPPTYKTNDRCSVIAGKWFGPFLSKIFTNSSDLDLDHVIPLKWAHQHGGWRWSAERKQFFANDWENLVIVYSGRNRSKGSRGPSEWMPDNGGHHCAYAFRWNYLIDKYNLTANRDDINSIDNVIRSCNLNENKTSKE